MLKTFSFEKALKFIKKGKKVWRVAWKEDKRIKNKAYIELNKENNSLNFVVGENILKIYIDGSDLLENDWYIVK